jgi:hypothetical protein
MNKSEAAEQTAIAIRLRQILLDLAHREDARALSEAAAVPYWEPHPTSVGGHRAAADVLRTEADRFLEAS